MAPPRFQFTLKRILWAMVWISIGLGIWKATSPFDLRHFADNDPDNIGPRMLAAFYLVPISGAIGALRGRPIAVASKAFLVWLPICAAIIAVGFARLI